MHTTKIGDWAFLHDGDPRGGTIIMVALNGSSTRVPFDVLREFVGGVVRTGAELERRRVSRARGRRGRAMNRLGSRITQTTE